MKRLLFIFAFLMGIHVSVNAGEANLFPNPAHNNLTINGVENIKCIEIYDFLGSKLFTENTNLQINQSIDISYLSPGRYFVKIYDDSGNQQVILLIKK